MTFILRLKVSPRALIAPNMNSKQKILILHTELKTPELILLEILEPLGSIAQIIDDSQQDLISSHSSLDNNFCLGYQWFMCYHKLSKFHAFRNCLQFWNIVSN